jgi:hypothetical protein
MTDSPQVPAIDAPPPTATALDRIVGIFTSPRETMRSIAKAPDWLIPLIVMLVLSAVAAFAMAPQVDTEAEVRAAIEKRFEGQEMSEQQRARIDDQIEGGAKFTKIMFQWGWFTLPLWILITAGILQVIFSLFGGKSRFAQAFSITTYAWLPLAARGLIASAVVAMREDLTAPSALAAASYTNPAFLVDIDKSRALFMFLSALDIFGIWSLVLLIFGFSFASGLSQRTTAIIMGSLWLIIVLLRVVPAMMQ